MLTVENKKIKRPEGKLPNCVACPKFIPWEKKGKDEREWKDQVFQNFKGQQVYLYNAYKAAKHFGTMPREGGSDNQDPFILDVIIMLADLSEQVKETQDIAVKSKMLEARIGV